MAAWIFIPCTRLCRSWQGSVNSMIMDDYTLCFLVSQYLLSIILLDQNITFVLIYVVPVCLSPVTLSPGQTLPCSHCHTCSASPSPPLHASLLQIPNKGSRGARSKGYPNAGTCCLLVEDIVIFKSCWTSASALLLWSDGQPSQEWSLSLGVSFSILQDTGAQSVGMVGYMAMILIMYVLIYGVEIIIQVEMCEDRYDQYLTVRSTDVNLICDMGLTND